MPAVPQMPRLGTTIVSSVPLLLLTIVSRSCAGRVRVAGQTWAMRGRDTAPCMAASPNRAHHAACKDLQPRAGMLQPASRARTSTRCVRLLRSRPYLK